MVASMQNLSNQCKQVVAGGASIDIMVWVYYVETILYVNNIDPVWFRNYLFCKPSRIVS